MLRVHQPLRENREGRSLAKAGFSDNKAPKVKICATGELTKRLMVKGIPCSAAAKAKIEAAGGTVA